MATVVTRNIPQIVLIDREELGTIDRIVLRTLYKTGIDEFLLYVLSSERDDLSEQVTGIQQKTDPYHQQTDGTEIFQHKDGPALSAVYRSCRGEGL